MGIDRFKAMESIQLYSKIITTLEAVNAWGDDMAKSGMYGCTRVEQGRQLAMICYTNNMTPDEVMARYDIIDGKLRKKATACLADFRKKGGKHKWIDDGMDGLKATCQFVFEGEQLTVTFRIEDAQRQGLVRPNSNWIKTPGNMLRARVTTLGVTMLAPEIVSSGLVDGDEEPMTPTPVSLNLPPPVETIANKKPQFQIIDMEAMKQRFSGLTQTPVFAPPVQNEAETEAAMGLRPVSTPAPKKTKAAPLEIMPEEPMPPPAMIEPEASQADPAPVAPKPSTKKPNMPSTKEQLDQDTIEEIGLILQGHFVEAANWMVKEGWISPSTQPIKTEAHASMHLQHTLPMLTKPRAKKILTQNLAFMRAIEEINP
jgi:hypothetical protein